MSLFQTSVIKKYVNGLDNARIEQKCQYLKQQIDQTDHEIDQMVYEPYGLTDEEIKIVEESVG